MEMRFNIYHLSLAVVIIAYLAFWFLLSTYMYESFTYMYLDIGSAASSLNIQLQHAGLVSGLEYLSFMTHVSPFHLLLLPVFWAFNSPLTLAFLQDIIIAATAVITFLAGRWIGKRDSMGFALAVAFLINPGTLALASYPFHLEVFMAFFFMLSLYLFMKGSRYFLLSYLALLTVFDIATIVGLCLLMGIAAYWLLYIRKRRAKSLIWNEKSTGFLKYAFAMTLLFIAFYMLADSLLLRAYALGAYPNIPSIMHIFGQFSQQAGGALHIFSLNGAYFADGLLLLFLVVLWWFGPVALVAAVPWIILNIPWLAEIFIVQSPNFLFTYSQDFSYATIGSLAAAIMGIEIVFQGRSSTLKRFRLLPISNKNTIIPSILVFSLIVGVLFFLVPIVTTAVKLGQQVAANHDSYSNITSLLSIIPRNSSVLADGNTATRLYYVYDLELPPDEGYLWSAPLNKSLYSFYWLNQSPDFVVFDKNFTSYNLMNNSEFNVYAYMQGNYTLYAEADGMYIYKKSG